MSHHGCFVAKEIREKENIQNTLQRPEQLHDKWKDLIRVSNTSHWLEMGNENMNLRHRRSEFVSRGRTWCEQIAGTKKQTTNLFD